MNKPLACRCLGWLRKSAYSIQETRDLLRPKDPGLGHKRVSDPGPRCVRRCLCLWGPGPRCEHIPASLCARVWEGWVGQCVSVGFRVCKSEVSGSNEFREGNLDGHRQSLAYRHARLYVQAVFPQSAGHLQHKAQACTVHDSFLQSWQQQRSWRRA